MTDHVTSVHPTFLVIGAYKCGTTSLHHYLRAHPDVFVPERKEPGYWAFVDETAGQAANPARARSVTDPVAYARMFEGRTTQRAAGEVSPEYMTNPTAVVAIARHLPEVRLVAIVRNPVERAFSDYLMNVRDGREPLPFMEALAEQDARASRGEPHGYYISTGFYGRQLRPYYESFDPTGILVVFAEDLRADRDATLHRVFTHIGVDPARAVEPVEQEFNRSGVPSSRLVALAYRARAIAGPLARRIVPAGVKHRIDGALQDRLERPELPSEAGRHLRELYRDDITELSRLTGRDLRTWLDD